MHEIDWDSLYENPAAQERDSIVAFLYHEAEALRGDFPLACYHLRRAAEAIIKGKHLGT